MQSFGDIPLKSFLETIGNVVQDILERTDEALHALLGLLLDDSYAMIGVGLLVAIVVGAAIISWRRRR